jgi:uncharacterized membrane protein YdjX (TVP38/TMEM64 family)
MQGSADMATVTAVSWRKLIVVGVFVAAIIAFFSFDLHRYLSLTTLKANRARLLEYTESHALTAIVTYIVTYVVVVTLSLPGATVLTLAGGFLFGALPATLYVNVAATSGATLAFLSARYVLRDWVQARFGHRLGVLQAGFEQNAFQYLLTLRLIPVFPFFLINLLAGLTRVSLGSYLAATALGIIPGSFVYAYAGRQLGTLDSVSEIATPRVLLAFTLLGLLTLVPVLYRKFAGRRAAAKERS